MGVLSIVKEVVSVTVDGESAKAVFEYLKGCRDDVDYITVCGETYWKTGVTGTDMKTGAPSIEWESIRAGRMWTSLDFMEIVLD